MVKKENKVMIVKLGEGLYTSYGRHLAEQVMASTQLRVENRRNVEVYWAKVLKRPEYTLNKGSVSSTQTVYDHDNKDVVFHFKDGKILVDKYGWMDGVEMVDDKVIINGYELTREESELLMKALQEKEDENDAGKEIREKLEGLFFNNR